MKNKKIQIYIVLMILIVILFLYHSNNNIQNSRYEVEVEYINEPITIVHLSDLHGKQFGTDNKNLIANIKNESPDLIVFTGDLIDAYRNENITESIEFLAKLAEYAPVCYIRGNHEYRSDMSDEIEQVLLEHSDEIIILQGNYEDLTIKNQKVSVLGYEKVENNVINDFEEKECLKIILHHYSENFADHLNLSRINSDIVFTGHAHGGQWRLPFIGGIYAPGQGFNPKYIEGVFEKDESTQVISRGLGNSLFPFRLFNRPEVVTVVVQ